MTDADYREFLSLLLERYVRPRIAVCGTATATTSRTSCPTT